MTSSFCDFSVLLASKTRFHPYGYNVTIGDLTQAVGRYTLRLNFEIDIQGLAHESVRQNPGSGTSRAVADHCGSGLCPDPSLRSQRL
ncbi:hypothetical protein EMIT0357P_30366 [Pseudomonas marginalis]